VIALLAELAINAVTLGSLYVLVALGYVLVYSVLRIFHLVHGDVVVLGGMLGIGVLRLAGVGRPGGIPAPLAILAAMAVAAAAGALVSWGIEVAIYRRIRTRSRLTPLLAALGLSMVLQNLLQLFTSKDPIPFPAAAIPQGYVEFAGVRLLYVSIVIIAAAMVLLAGVAAFVRGTSLGTAMLAVAQDSEAAVLIGIPVRRVTAAGFVLAGSLAGAAGVLFAMYIGSLTWFIGAGFGIRGFSAALIGGLSSIGGAGLGGYVLAFGEIFGVGLSFGPFQLDPSWRDAVAFCLVVLVLLLRPEGLIGGRVFTWQVRN
jgi:branched-chain amino acid transport system permease protein